MSFEKDPQSNSGTQISLEADGMLGMQLDKENGLVVQVNDGSQAQRLGVSANWQIVQIDGEPYSAELYMEKASMLRVLTFNRPESQVEEVAAIPEEQEFDTAEIELEEVQRKIDFGSVPAVTYSAPRQLDLAIQAKAPSMPQQHELPKRNANYPAESSSLEQYMSSMQQCINDLKTASENREAGNGDDLDIMTIPLYEG